MFIANNWRNVVTVSLYLLTTVFVSLFYSLFHLLSLKFIYVSYIFTNKNIISFKKKKKEKPKTRKRYCESCNETLWNIVAYVSTNNYLFTVYVFGHSFFPNTFFDKILQVHISDTWIGKLQSQSLECLYTNSFHMQTFTLIII